MKSDNQIRQEGFKAFFDNMDIVDAERFIAIINSERFNYTQWRDGFFTDLSVEEIFEKGRKFVVDFRKIKGNI